MRRRVFARTGQRSTVRRLLVGLSVVLAVLAAVAAAALALRGREIAERLIYAVAAPDQVQVRSVGWSGLSLGSIRFGGPDGPAASAVEIGWTPGSLLRGRVGRVRIENLTIKARIEAGEIVIMGLPRGGDARSEMPVLPLEQVELAGARLALAAGTVRLESTIDATIVPLDSGAVSGRAAIDALVEPGGGKAVHVTADLREWRLSADAAGLQLSIAAAALAIPQQHLAVSDFDARIDTGPTRSARAAFVLRDETAPARIAPLAIAVEGSTERETMVFSGRAATTDNALVATFKGRHEIASGRGTAELASQPVTFVPGGVQPADIVPAFADMLRRVEGAVSATATAAWGDTLRSSGTAVLDDLGFESGVARISGLSGTIRLSSLMPVRSAGAQRITGRIDVTGLPAMPLDLRFTLPGEDRILINAATLGFAGGTLALTDLLLASGKPVDTALAIRGVDLGAVLQLMDVDGLSGTGRIEGAIPVRVDPGGASIRSGQLAGMIPGVIRYTGSGLPEPAPDAPPTDPIRLMRAALADFHYTGVTLTLERGASGEGSLLINLKGANPQVLDNHPFVFNIRLDANFDKLAAILFDGYAAAEELIRRRTRP